MVTEIDIVIVDSITVSCEISMGVLKNHASLENLDYEHSGHTGFASSAALAQKVDKTDLSNQLYGTNLAGGQYLVPYSVLVRGHTIPQRDSDGQIECGTPTSDAHATPKSYVDGKHSSLFRDGLIKEELIPGRFMNVMEFAKQVSGASFLSDTLATDPGTVVWCAATKAIAGDDYYRKFIVNGDGTMAGLSTIDPEFDKLYVGKTDNNVFKWSGSNLLEVSKSLSLGETSTTAYAGNKGKANADAIAGLRAGTLAFQELQIGSDFHIHINDGDLEINGGRVTLGGNAIVDEETLWDVTDKIEDMLCEIAEGALTSYPAAELREYDLVFIHGYKAGIGAPNQMSFVIFPNQITAETNVQFPAVAGPSDWEYRLRFNVGQDGRLYWFSASDYGGDYTFVATQIFGLRRYVS